MRIVIWSPLSCFCYLLSFLFLVHMLLSSLSILPDINSAVTAQTHPPCVSPLSPQTVEHGFPHQPSALGYSPSLQLLAIGTRSGAIKLYPSLPECKYCEGIMWASCLNLRQALLVIGCDAAKSMSAVVPASGVSFSHAVAQCACHSHCGVCVAFHTVQLTDSAAEPLGTLSHSHRHTLVWITAWPPLIMIIHSHNTADCGHRWRKIFEWHFWKCWVLHTEPENRAAPVEGPHEGHKSFDDVMPPQGGISTLRSGSDKQWLSC